LLPPPGHFTKVPEERLNQVAVVKALTTPPAISQLFILLRQGASGKGEHHEN
jgi:hypothetical protein